MKSKSAYIIGVGLIIGLFIFLANGALKEIGR